VATHTRAPGVHPPPPIHGVPSCEWRAAEPSLPLPEPQLANAQLVVRPFRANDALALAGASRDPDVAHFTSLPADWPEEEAAAWIERAEQARRDGHSLCLAISDRASGGLLGGVSLISIDLAAKSCELGYWLTAQARGRGAAAEATTLLGDWALRTLELERLELHIDPANVRSVDLAKRCGYRFVRLLPVSLSKGELLADGLWERRRSRDEPD
jgi:RimJ/RimL family protein N-acetyltransferase